MRKIRDFLIENYRSLIVLSVIIGVIAGIGYTAWDYDRTDFKMVAYVGGEGEGIYRKVGLAAFYGNELKGLSRREMFVDARSLSSKAEDGQEPLTNAEYYAILNATGKAALMDALWKFQTETEAIQSAGCTFGVDFFLGDTVTSSDSYGLSHNPRARTALAAWQGRP